MAPPQSAALPAPAAKDAPAARLPAVPAGFVHAGRNEQGKHEFVHEKSGLRFVYLDGGTFTQGSPDDEAGRQAQEGPQRQVTLAPFLIAKYEVTQEVWERFAGSQPAQFAGDAQRPVENVSWHDAVRFCEFAELAPKGRGELALPTEAQWEFACRAGTTGPFAGPFDELAWHHGNSGQKTQPVGTKAPNAWGLHDLHGNVSEWCRDWIERYDGAPVSDPRGASRGRGRVVRGGCWRNVAEVCRSAFRFRIDPALRTPYLGFRPALRAPD